MPTTKRNPQIDQRAPILILLAILLIVGLLTFPDYGLSWDEPLFYKYADALGYAYSPGEWLGGHFDLSRAYGPSGDDHKTRGPAYLLLAREPVYLLERLGLDEASAWHFVNFLCFLLGVYFLYRLCLRWVKPWAAFSAAALFSAQPLLWGHAFINPKDPSFLVFFLGSVVLGFEMVDRLAGPSSGETKVKALSLILLPAIFLGLTTSIRILGPLAGLLVLVYFLVRQRIGRTGSPPYSKALWLLLYILIAALTALATWPYLWEDPLGRFLEVLRLMSANPTSLSVLFGGELYRAYELPRRYLPVLLAITLTEPVWPLFLLGLIAAFRKAMKQELEWQSLVLVLAWFVIPFAYVLLRRPPMYDGFRHFLLILPPVFVVCGLALDAPLNWLRPYWLSAVLILALLAPGVVAGIQLHPYEYAYYNAFIGGTGGAFRRYETDYWLTCYKEAVEQFSQTASRPANLYVRREAYIAATYAPGGIHVNEYRGEAQDIQPGDYILVNTRSNEDLKTFRGAPMLLSVGRSGAAFCVIKQVP